jgi:hypothetical protein
MGGFFYTVESLRVDGNLSAHPDDYAELPPDVPVGAELHAFLRAWLSSDLLPADAQPKDGSPRVTWPVPHSYLLVRNPTREDLEWWANVRRLRIGCTGKLAVER